LRLRLIYDGFRRAVWNMALDEALLSSCVERGEAALRIYGFSPSAVTLGRFRPLSDVDLDYASRIGVEVVRRPTGGGTVFHDEAGEVTYSLVAPEDWVGPPLEAYRRICGGIVAAAEALGVEAVYKAPNDVLARGGKFSGSAQLRRGGCVLQHGTFMYATRLGLARRLLRKWGRVTTLEAAAGRRIGFYAAAAALVEGITGSLGAEAFRDGFRLEEIEAAGRIVERYFRDGFSIVPGKPV